MTNIDVLMVWCTAVDYPLTRLLLRKYRNKFNKILISGSKHHGVLTLENYLKRVFPETWLTLDINWTTPGIDWRQAETEPCLTFSDSEWILFLEQDFFCDNWDKLWEDVEKAMETSDAIGWWNLTHFPYLHPSFFLVKREALDKTKKDFSAHSEINGGDHFSMITHDLVENGAKITRLQDLGWTDPKHAFHLGGLTSIYQNFDGDNILIGVRYPHALATYNRVIQSLDLDPEFRTMCNSLDKVLEKRGIIPIVEFEKFFTI